MALPHWRPRRIAAFDLLRGFFVAAIIINHLQLWPSPLSFVTGQGRLWASAAEGFFIMSGLLVGLIYGRQKADRPLPSLVASLWRRAAILYLWGVGISFALIVFTMLVGTHPRLPDLPITTQPIDTMLRVISMQYFSGWIYFLRMYAIMLAVTPLFLWLLRRRQYGWVGISIGAAYGLGFLTTEPSLQWQVLFFGAGLIGFWLPAIMGWVTRSAGRRRWLSGLAIGLFLLTAAASYLIVLGHQLPLPASVHASLADLNHNLQPLFSKDPYLMPLRILVAFVWFAGGLALVQAMLPALQRTVGWLLTPLGQTSLRGYCLQALVLPPLAVFLPPNPGQVANSLLALGAVVAVWALGQTALVRRLVPQ